MPTTVAIGDITISQQDLDQLIGDIEQHLATAPAPTKPGIPQPDAAELVRQTGIATGPAWRQKTPRARATPEIDLPGRLRSMLPRRRPRTVQHVSVARHLELTLEVLERYGWARTGSGVVTVTGRRCILGAQLALLSLGVGDRDTLDRAGGYLNHTLRARGVTAAYYDWNEGRRTYGDVRHLLTTAIDKARKAGH